MAARRSAPTARVRYADCVEVCGRLDHPGLATDDPLWVDHTRDETTVDQARIEDALDSMDLNGRALLHVGVGNSGLARRFAARLGSVDGLTVSEAELTMARATGIANYTVHLLSKYGREFVLTIPRAHYDYVVDNNLASYACCKFHFHRMLDNYVWCLRPGGRILTDQRGMDFTVEDDPRWKLTYDDLVALGDLFPLVAGAVTDTVYELRLRT